MPYPTAAAIAHMRAVMETTLTAACTIYRSTDGTTPYVLVEETVCDVEISNPLATPFEITRLEMTDVNRRWVSLPYDADVQRGYEIDVGTNTYAILDTTTDDTDPMLVVAECNLIPQPERPA